VAELTLTLVQMDCRLGDPAGNFARAEKFVAEAARRGSHLVLLPELWSTAYDLERAAEHASPLARSPEEPGWFGRFAQMARDHGVWLAGSLLEARNGRFYNTLAVYAADGSLAAAYSKVHLFRLMDEHLYLAPGDRTATVETPWGVMGLSICYDLRFPELSRRYALEGAQVILVPAEWPYPRRMHWRTLLRARAIENQCFVAACNRVGTTRDTAFFGASGVVDPWGETLIEGGDVEALLTVTLDLDRVQAFREQIPIFQDRRPDLYG